MNKFQVVLADANECDKQIVCCRIRFHRTHGMQRNIQFLSRLCK